MASLGVKFCGVDFPNPVILASGFPAGVGSGPFLRRIAEEGAGGVVARSTFLDEVAPARTLRPKYAFFGNSLVHFDAVYEKAEFFYGQQASLAKVKGVPLIASIIGRSIEEYREQVKMANNSPFIDLVEINVSCPGMGEFGMKMKYDRSNISQEPGLVREIVSECRRVTTKPIVVKLSAVADDIGVTARAAVDGGANAIAAINTLPNGLAPIDIETGKPSLPILGVCGGEMIKPFALGAVVLIRKAVNVPVIGIGGVFGWRDAVEMLMAGASLVGISTASVRYGPRIFPEVVRDLEKFLDSHGYRSVADIQGMTLRHVWTLSELPPSDLISWINPELCTKCGRCLDICAYLAISLEPSPTVNAARCAGCALCFYICPAEAVTMKNAKEEKE